MCVGAGGGRGGGSFSEAVWGEVFWRPVGWRVGGVLTIGWRSGCIKLPQSEGSAVTEPRGCFHRGGGETGEEGRGLREVGTISTSSLSPAFLLLLQGLLFFRVNTACSGGWDGVVLVEGERFKAKLKPSNPEGFH